MKSLGHYITLGRGNPIKKIFLKQVQEARPWGLIGKLLDCGLEVSKFELSSAITYMWGLVTLGKLWAPYYNCCSSTLNNSRNSICLLTKETQRIKLVLSVINMTKYHQKAKLATRLQRVLEWLAFCLLANKHSLAKSITVDKKVVLFTLRL